MKIRLSVDTKVPFNEKMRDPKSKEYKEFEKDFEGGVSD